MAPVPPLAWLITAQVQRLTPARMSSGLQYLLGSAIVYACCKAHTEAKIREANR